ncbi:hypothetical protein CALVIDRAFT_501771 [Calocera viscosa TUFC12733]|uniref:ATPase assembly factor ATP10 n=1 Tax=Calocera viscosa (strain TUFC12733) TaxID=1330018 RepID=A0A167K2K2_CALVF|nr:hypothetical protein CALVIDRAFT_501771 [Calocera viscosa TUFC12733]
MPLRFLDRPLGLPRPPTTKKRGWKELNQDLLDRERMLEERQHLVKQIMTGYYNDVNQLKYHGGKRWTAPEVLVKADKALYFPDIIGAALTGDRSSHTTDLCQGKVSIVCFIGSQMAEKHIADFTKLALESFGDDPDLRFVQINLQENPLKAFLVSMFASRIKTQVPEKFHPYYLLSSHNMEYYREPLGCTNKMLGYVYLLDEDLKVRWAGGGHPNPEEQVSLHRCTGVLLKRFKEKKVAAAVAGKPGKGGNK